jgi:hypothetical protein
LDSASPSEDGSAWVNWNSPNHFGILLECGYFIAFSLLGSGEALDEPWRFFSLNGSYLRADTK